MTPEEKRRPRGMWDEDFEDISSHSRNNSITSSERGEVELPDWLNRSDEDTSSRDRRAPDWELPDWDVSSHALPERRPHAVTSSVGSTDRRPASQRKREKGRLTGVRRFLAITVVLAMTVGTLLLAAFLLFKLSEITLTGESVPGATPEKVVEVCGYEAGDNLLFLPTKAQEEAIEQAFPYVAQSEIIKHFPSTLEICLTLAPRAAVVEEAGGWVVLSPAGKVVEIGTEPPLGLLQITGVNASAEPGQLYVPEDEAVAAAFSELMAALSDRDAFTHFTRMDLSDLSDIRLVYENRDLL